MVIMAVEVGMVMAMVVAVLLMVVVVVVMVAAAVAVVVAVGGRDMKALSLKCSAILRLLCVRAYSYIQVSPRNVTPYRKRARPNTRGACANRGRYFGGVVAFNQEDFEKINGFPNTFWGWGGEDDEMYSRIVEVTEPDRMESILLA